MKQGTRWGWGCAALAVVSAGAVDARADAAGDKALAAVDEAANRAKTLRLEYEVVNQEAGKPERHMGLRVWMKGEKRRAEFTAGDMKGTTLLVSSPTQMYVYLPAFGKVRRIANNQGEQGFMGLTFSPADLATKYADRYGATITAESPGEMVLTATLLPGQSGLAKVVFTVAKDKMLPTKVEYYDAKGVGVRAEERTGYTCEGNVCTPGEVKMTDLTKNGAWTKLVRKAWKVNDDVSDDLFSKRSLE